MTIETIIKIILSGILVIMVLSLLKKPSFSSPSLSPVKKWLGENWLDIFLVAGGLVLFHSTLYWLAPDFWSAWWSQKWFLCFQLALVTGICLYIQKHKGVKFVGFMVCVPALIGVGVTVRSAIVNTQNAEQMVAEIRTLGRTGASSSGCLQSRNAEVEKEVREYFLDRLPVRQAEAMILIIERESQFNQFQKDGKTPYRRCPTPDNPSTAYVGLAQISEDTWLETARKLGPKYNFYNSVQGNLEFSLWVFKKYGFAPWRTSLGIGNFSGNAGQPKSQEPAPQAFTITAPIGTDENGDFKWSEKVNIQPGKFPRFSYSGKVRFRIKNGQEFDSQGDGAPGTIHFDRDNAGYMEYRSRGEEPITITVNPKN